jgi:hypothetical protein
MAVQQITQDVPRHELPFLPLGKVTTSFDENGLDDDTDNNNGFMQSTCNGY